MNHKISIWQNTSAIDSELTIKKNNVSSSAKAADLTPVRICRRERRRPDSLAADGLDHCPRRNSAAAETHKIRCTPTGGITSWDRSHFDRLHL